MNVQIPVNTDTSSQNPYGIAYARFLKARAEIVESYSVSGDVPEDISEREFEARDAYFAAPVETHVCLQEKISNYLVVNLGSIERQEVEFFNTINADLVNLQNIERANCSRTQTHTASNPAVARVVKETSNLEIEINQGNLDEKSATEACGLHTEKFGELAGIPSQSTADISTKFKAMLKELDGAGLSDAPYLEPLAKSIAADLERLSV